MTKELEEYITELEENIGNKFAPKIGLGIMKTMFSMMTEEEQANLMEQIKEQDND